MNYKPVIGLEIHVELKTKSKMFCQCSAFYFGKKPNTNTCPVCLGMPGTLPVPNEEAVKWTILIGKALNCTINSQSKFDRKNYFYPDIPKGYQISQYDEPIAVNGYLEVRSQKSEVGSAPKKFRIHRVHLEEDTGKLMHQGSESLVDFNRSGVPLVEIVTEADFDSAEDVKEFLIELHTIIKYLGVSDADMEKGSMRMEPNISVRSLKSEVGSQKSKDGREVFEMPKYKVEVKNINSFNFVKRAIDYEVKRHIEILERGETPLQETRGYVEADSSTKSQRTKEDAHDYRYFPEPDIPPMSFTKEYIDSIQVPELSSKKIEVYTTQYKIRLADAKLIARNKEVADFFENCIKLVKPGSDMPQKIVNAILNKKISRDLSPTDFIKKVEDLNAPKSTDMGKLHEVVTGVISSNQKVVDDIKKGKENAVMYLVGQVMKEMKGQADALTVKNELLKRLKG